MRYKHTERFSNIVLFETRIRKNIVRYTTYTIHFILGNTVPDEKCFLVHHQMMLPMNDKKIWCTNISVQLTGHFNRRVEVSTSYKP